MAAAAPGSSAGRHHELVFDVTLEIREEDSKGNYGAVPKDRNYFKIRSGVEKKASGFLPLSRHLSSNYRRRDPVLGITTTHFHGSL